jgi:DNA replication ATP-dependent helicase Dna2
MYALSKRVISQYIRTGCRRRLRLDLYRSDKARKTAGVPVKDSARPHLRLLTEQGRQFEREKFAELVEIFGTRVTSGHPFAFEPGEESVFSPIELCDHIINVQPNDFLLEVEYDVVPGFIAVHGLTDLVDGRAIAGGGTLTMKRVRPDIIRVVPSDGSSRRVIRPDGTMTATPAGDRRTGLRVIDIKATGEASPAHFTELAYYGMTLAAWLDHYGYADRFIVLAEAAIWPGKHDASAIRQLEIEERRNHVIDHDLGCYVRALETDLETMPPEVVLDRVVRFLTVDLRAALGVASWRVLPWHIDHRCGGCDYLGYRWSRHDTPQEGDAESPDQDYCWPTAERSGHLSRIAGLSEGACGKLRSRGVGAVAAVSALAPENPVFDAHQALRAARTVLRDRAEVLSGHLPARIPHRAGTSAVLPRFADIRVAISADYDVGSGLTFAFGYEMTYGVPTSAAGPSATRQFQRRTRPLLVEEKALNTEGAIFHIWLSHLVQEVRDAAQAIIAAKRAHGWGRTDATIQFFIWDRLTFNHLCRLMGRHLLRVQGPAQIPGVDTSLMSWLFPGEATLEDADYVGRDSPITIVANAINSILAAPIPHHYSLVEVAHSYFPNRLIRADGTRWEFRINRFYRDPLSDQIPSERGHEIWNRRSPFRDGDYQAHRQMVRDVVSSKLSAMLAVVERLTTDLRDQLVAEAPTVNSILNLGDRLATVPEDGQILYQHARLMAAAQKLDVDLVMAMPPHEREARFRSVRLDATLIDAQRTAELRQQGLISLVNQPEIFVFRMSHRSREAKIKAGDFNWSLMPEDAQSRMQEWSLYRFKSEYPAMAARLPIEPRDRHIRLREKLRVEIVRFDRNRLMLVAHVSDLFRQAVDRGVFDLNFDAHQRRFGVIDPLAIDYFTHRTLKPALEAIRTPPLALSRPLFQNPAIARVTRARRPRRYPSVPAERFIWDAERLSREATGRPAAPVLQELSRIDPRLTPRQRTAIEYALTCRLSVWWGPPGTGKSATAADFIAGLVWQARAQGRGIRIGITGPTWVAIDNVTAKLPEIFAREVWSDDTMIARLASRPPARGAMDESLRRHLVSNDSPAFLDLGNRLRDPHLITIVGGTAERMFKLCGDGLVPCFDVLLIDEASQMDVAHAIVAFTKLTDDASVVVVGDHLQMPPIHPIEAPDGMTHLVGSIYDFYARYRETEPGVIPIVPIMLNRSFRSNAEIVDFVRLAGYGGDLQSAHPTLRIGLHRDRAATRPPDWPAYVSWGAYLDLIVSPDRPLIGLIHPDLYSSQRNEAEADLVAGLVLTLHRRGLLNLERSNVFSYDDALFFRHGVGIVTPHRAQQAAILDRLDESLPPHVDRAALYAAVDTVERFQGQEKAVMIASFGLGDVDQIAAEEEFLYSLNRFNVIASRAKAKLIVIMSRHLMDYLPHDRQALEESRLLKHYATGFLRQSRAVTIPGFEAPCELKY